MPGFSDEFLTLTGLPPKAAAILEAILYRGELPRGDADTIVGTGERQARRIVSALIDRGVLASENPRAPLRLRFPAELASRDCFRNRAIKSASGAPLSRISGSIWRPRVMRA
ncbi:MAG TPA: hypothetical protein VHY84_11510 [Bryobacteraceae bacterium]|jgi:hypothetical protein|nr:hypothetical protein [Bryobacteraceae bacterium]